MKTTKEEHEATRTYAKDVPGSTIPEHLMQLILERRGLGGTSSEARAINDAYAFGHIDGALEAAYRLVPLPESSPDGSVDPDGDEIVVGGFITGGEMGVDPADAATDPKRMREERDHYREKYIEASRLLLRRVEATRLDEVRAETIEACAKEAAVRLRVRNADRRDGAVEFYCGDCHATEPDHHVECVVTSIRRLAKAKGST
jgi:hypothetical protein